MLGQAPEEKLRCSTCKGKVRYYIDDQYLTKSQLPYAAQLAQRDYCQKLDKKLNEYQELLEKLQKLYAGEELENIYRKLHEARKELVIPLAKPIEYQIDKFEKILYESKGFSEDETREFYTAKGERVRSKSEKIIADELFRCGIPYKYECPLELMDWNRTVTIYPDFTVLNRRTGEKWILEHLGMMDKPSYCESTMRKLELYEKNDILIGKKLIIFHETSNAPLNIKVVQKYIEEYLC